MIPAAKCWQHEDPCDARGMATWIEAKSARIAESPVKNRRLTDVGNGLE